MPGLLDDGSPLLRRPRDGDGDGFVLDTTHPTPVEHGQGPSRPPGDAAPAPAPGTRAFGDPKAIRDRIYANVLDAARAWKPIQNQRHTLSLESVGYEDPSDYDIVAQKTAILRGETLGRRLRGDWVLRDNATSAEVDRRRTTLATVPYITPRGTFIQGGNEYTLAHQLRLRPGAYTRIKENGELETHNNVSGGLAHRIFLEPATQVFRLTMGQAKMPLVPVLKAMGVSDRQLMQHWGNEIGSSNLRKDDPSVINKLHAKINRGRAEEGQTPAQTVAAAFSRMTLDPDVMKRTLGKPYDRVTPEMLIDVTKKLLSINRGEGEPDDRDHLAYMTLHGPEDLIAERLGRDRMGLRKVLWRASMAGSLRGVPTNLFTRSIQSAITSSGLGQPLESINPSQIFEQQGRVSRMGEGGIPSLDAVPDESRNVQPSHFGFIDPLVTPESLRVGVDSRIARNARKGDDGRIYSPFRDAHSGATVWRSPQDVADAVVAFPGELESGRPHVAAMEGGRISFVPRGRVQYQLPHMEDAFSPVTNLVPLKSAVKGQRAVMAGRMITQALPVEGAEAPLVQSGVPGSDNDSYENLYGEHMGALRAQRGGTVLSVSPDEIVLRGPGGGVQRHQLYNNFPYNRKTYIHQSSTVRPGQVVGPGDLLAKSNYTDDQGVTALGKNARVAYVPFRGLNFEDAIVISESFARRMRSQHMYQQALDLDEGITPGLKAHVSIFPGKYDRKTLANFDEDGVVKPGTVISQDHPLILAVKKREIGHNSISRGRKASWDDHSVTWDHTHDGVVTDVAKTPKGIVVSVKTHAETEVGDKLSGRYGDKGIISAIVPDNEMPHGMADGKPYEVLLNPLGIISRCYDEETEFLTQDGWKFGREVLRDELLACYDTAADSVSFQAQMIPMHAAVYQGPMLRYKNKVADFCVTPGHRMWARLDYAGANWQEKLARDLFGRKGYMVPVATGKPVPGADPADFVLPPYERATIKDSHWSDDPIVIDAGDWSEFLGWYVAEGNVTWNAPGREYRTHIAQSKDVNPAKHEAIATLLSRLPFSWNYNPDNIQFHVGSKRLAAYLRPLGLAHEKYIPAWVFQQTPGVRQRFLDAYWSGDGSDCPNNAGSLVSSASTVSRRLADDLQRLGVMQGSCFSIYPIAETRRPNQRHGWRISWSRCRHRCLDRGKWNEVTYDGMIYCPSVPTGYVVTRRNGRILIAGNTNPAQMHEAALGKIAALTGNHYRVQDFQGQDLNQFAIDELTRHGLSDREDLVDPVRGTKIKGVFTGNRFFMKLHHTAESKGQGRGTAGYTMEGRPARGGPEGSKKISLMDVNAILSHGATEVLRDAGAIRGQAHPELWQQYMSGHKMPTPKVPAVYEKFIAMLKGAGINVVRDGTRLNIMALTDRDVDTLAGDRALHNAETVDWKEGLRPVEGGLFDPHLTGGHGGNRWSHIVLSEPMPNPAMEEPIRRILGLTEAKFRDVLAGRGELRGLRGPAAIRQALEQAKVPDAIVAARGEIVSGRKGVRDAAVRKLGYLRGVEKTGVHPRDWMMTKVPVLPPIFRPVAVMAGSKLPLVADPNYLYRELHDANRNLAEMRGVVGDLGEERLALYDAFKAVVGLGDPLHPKDQERQVRGILRHVFGTGGPKTGIVQRKLLGSSTDLVGRAVITPNPDLDMDQVGIPEARAWDVYKPFIVRRLVRRGLPHAAAAQHVADRTNTARSALLEEMDERPVILNRAPVLHRYGVMAFRPRLTRGNVLQVSPLVVVGFGADFDGDAMQYHVPASAEAVDDALEKMLPSRNLLAVADYRVHQLPSKEFGGGLYSATTAINPKAPPRVYRTLDDVTRAYRSGEVSVDHPVHVLEP